MKDSKMTTKEDIKEWLSRNEGEYSHMIVACDIFDYSDYPVYVKKTEHLDDHLDRLGAQEMTVVMEFYSYSMDLEAQLNEERAFNK